MARGGRRARVALAGCALLLAWAIAFKVRSVAGMVVAVPICVGAAALAVRARAEHAQIALMVLSVLLALNSCHDRHYMLSSAPARASAAAALLLWARLLVEADPEAVMRGSSYRGRRSSPFRSPSTMRCGRAACEACAGSGPRLRP
jgi:hypothetical protein